MSQESVSYEEKAEFLKSFCDPVMYRGIRATLSEARGGEYVSCDEVDSVQEMYSEQWPCAMVGWNPTVHLIRSFIRDGTLRSGASRQQIIEACDDYFGMPHSEPIADDVLEKKWRKEYQKYARVAETNDRSADAVEKNADRNARDAHREEKRRKKNAKRRAQRKKQRERQRAALIFPSGV